MHRTTKYQECPGCGHARTTMAFVMTDVTGRETLVWYCTDCSEEVAVDVVVESGYAFGFAGIAELVLRN